LLAVLLSGSILNMILERCVDCVLFELKTDQTSSETTVNMADRLINSSDPLMSQLAMVAYRAGMSGMGDRSCSAQDEAFATARCSRPDEFTPKDKLINKS
jgi:hypothetical protein